MATVRPCWRTKFTAAVTSATSTQRTIASGRRSIIPLYTLRATSYSLLAGVIKLPRRSADSLLGCSSTIRFSNWFGEGRNEPDQKSAFDNHLLVTFPVVWPL